MKRIIIDQFLGTNLVNVYVHDHSTDDFLEVEQNITLSTMIILLKKFANKHGTSYVRFNEYDELGRCTRKSCATY